MRLPLLGGLCFAFGGSGSRAFGGKPRAKNDQVPTMTCLTAISGEEPKNEPNRPPFNLTRTQGDVRALSTMMSVKIIIDNSCICDA